MRYSELSYRSVLEGFAKINLLFFCVLPFVLYFTQIQIVDYFTFMKLQVVAWVCSILFAKLYEKLRFSKHDRGGAIYCSSLYVGIVISSGLFMLFAEMLFHKVETFEVVAISAAVCLLWIVYSFITLKIQGLCKFKWYITLLDCTVSYRNFLQIFLLFNISFAFVILIFVLTNIKYSVVELFFILMYLEAAFFVFHIVVGKIVDRIWNGASFRKDTVSLMGLVVASVLYVIKFKLVEERFFGVFEDVYINDYKVLILVISLLLFWTFFTLLFNFKTKKQSSPNRMSLRVTK